MFEQSLHEWRKGAHLIDSNNNDNVTSFDLLGQLLEALFKDLGEPHLCKVLDIFALALALLSDQFTILYEVGHFNQLILNIYIFIYELCQAWQIQMV